MAGAYLWQWFLELDGGRQSNGWGLNTLAWTDLDAWARLTRRRPTPSEVDTLRALDRARIVAAAPKKKAGE